MQPINATPIVLDDGGGCAVLPAGRPGFMSRTACTAAEMQLVISVRRQAYAEAGLDLAPDVIEDAFDQAGNTRSYLLFDGAKAVGTIRTSFRIPELGWLSTPFSVLYQAEIDACLSARSYVEVTRLALIATERRLLPRRLFLLMQNVAAAADNRGCQYILAPTRNDHVRFYLEMGFQRIGEPRVYLQCPIPSELLALDWWAERDRLRCHKRYQYLFSDRNLQEVM